MILLQVIVMVAPGLMKKKQWKNENSTNKWKEENLKIIVTRMQGWQLNTFRESYK